MIRLDRREGLFFLAIFGALIVRLALAPPIWHHGEAREGLVVQGIVHTHQWILPSRNGEMPSKPPFFHWLAALPAFVFGPIDWVVRLPSAIAAAIMAAVTFFMGREMGGRRVGWLAAGALLGMQEFWVSGTQARVDMVFATCLSVALAGFFFWYCNGHRAARATCYVASACAVLAKGPVGLVLPGLTIAGFLAVEGRLRSLWSLWSWPLTAVVLLLDLGWYALAYDIGGSEFLILQIAIENVDRFFGHGPFSSQNTALSTLGWLASQTLPWNLVLVWSLIRWKKGRARGWSWPFSSTHGGFQYSWFFWSLRVRGRFICFLCIRPSLCWQPGRSPTESPFLRRTLILSPLRKLGRLGACGTNCNSRWHRHRYLRSDADAAG